MSAHTRHVLSLPMDTTVRSKLICCGFSTVEDFKEYLSEEKLKAAVNITQKEARDVLNVIQPYIEYKPLRAIPNTCGLLEAQMSSKIFMKSVSYLLRESLKKQHMPQRIVSFSSEVDSLLGGGFPLGKITEIAGEAGLGKTQFCFQLCVDVQIPTCLGGVGGQAVYLDVEGTFFPQRVAEISTAAAEHCSIVANVSENVECIQATKKLTTESIMSGIYLFRCRNSVQLLAATHRMKEFLKDHPKVKLLIVDSVAQSVRGDEDMRTRTKFLVTLGRMYRDLVVEFGIAVVLTNQVSTRINSDGSFYNIPALGASWSHIASVKLMLKKENGSRYLHQYKSPICPNGFVEYRVTSEGIRDIETQEATQPNSSTVHGKDILLSQAMGCNSTQENSSVQFYPITQGMANELMEDWGSQKTSSQAGESQKEESMNPGGNAGVHEENIPDKWLLLSQRQLRQEDQESNEESSSYERKVLLEASFEDSNQPGGSGLNKDRAKLDDFEISLQIPDEVESRMSSSSDASPNHSIRKTSESAATVENHTGKTRKMCATQTVQCTDIVESANIMLSLPNLNRKPGQARNCYQLKAKAAVQATVEALLYSDSPVRAPPKKKRIRSDEDVTITEEKNISKRNNLENKSDNTQNQNFPPPPSEIAHIEPSSDFKFTNMIQNGEKTDESQDKSREISNLTEKNSQTDKFMVEDHKTEDFFENASPPSPVLTSKKTKRLKRK